ncbi:LacI family DNA-binding transcriptional regulator [Phytoactinopolyspora halotolerans]|uniref:LacI family transcriptional regulator n=1 Tax=Phytoactinopolyspora halotolerans TaxID=1981512 RepID=A0A6L9S4Z3_9ACTN|nr:LacI family DNA-binding transcriptional regulator [Phytoactinopolyspora halotolerans]NED99567.1 LacI family transcriptional regulator [Phytoactinopolyspora halotolerans]
MTVRLKDVAEQAGVSIKTVSNVVHGHIHVTDETRLKVQKAIDELGYRPNLSARSLRTGRTNIIALAVPRLSEPYFAELADQVVHAADRHGYTVLVDHTEGQRDRESAVVSGIQPQFIDGILFSPLALETADLEAAPAEVPFVLLGEHVAATGRADHVSIDNVAAARAATDHLIALGRRRIAVIGARRARRARTVAPRVKGFRQAHREAGLTVDSRLLIPTERLDRPNGAQAMGHLLDLDEPPDAVFCVTDMLAVGALRTLADRGVAVPDDVAVVGFDGIADGLYCVPRLTTIAPDKEQLATTAIDALMQRITTRRDEAPRELHVDFDLMVRESTAGRAAAS